MPATKMMTMLTTPALLAWGMPKMRPARMEPMPMIRPIVNRARTPHRM